MKETEGITKKIRSSIPGLRKKYNLKRIGVFGSYARGEQTKKSDLDLLVEFESPVSLLEFIALERDLSRLSGRKVDLVMKTALKPRIGKRILKEVVYL
jgi:uncharacterized protein